MKARLLVPFAVLTLAGSARAQSAPAPASPSAAELVPTLRKGGYVLVMRHPATNPDQADTDPLHLDNVKAQRQLSDAGREQARSVGAALRQLKIPFEKVVSSKFNRAQEAAKLLGIAEVTASVDVSEGGLVVSPHENQRRAAALKELLGTAPAKGKNVMIVSHKPNIQDAAGKELGDMGEAEIAVFQPLGGGKFKLVARVAPPETWTRWATTK